MAAKKKSRTRIPRGAFFKAWMNKNNTTVKQVAAYLSKKYREGEEPLTHQAVRARAKTFRENLVDLPVLDDENSAMGWETFQMRAGKPTEKPSVARARKAAEEAAK